MEKNLKGNSIYEVKSEKYGIFLRMNIAKEKKDNINNYEKVMKSFIRYCKDKYNMEEYVACLELSEGEYMHIHMYINQFLPLKEINKKWCELTGITEELKGNIYMVKVKDEIHKANILKYIWKDPIRTWICQSYKDKYSWISGKKSKTLELKEEKKIKTGMQFETIENAANGKPDEKKESIQRKLQDLKFICAEHKRERTKKFKNQSDLEKEIIILNTVEDLRKKGGKNFKSKIIVLNKIALDLESYIVYDQISKDMLEKTKKVMLLNMSYIALQLENIKESHYIYYKLGEKLFKYYDVFKLFYNKLIEDNKKNINNVKKITKKEWILIYENFHKSDDYKMYKEQIIKIGAKYFSIFKNLFYDININKNLVLKKEIKEKIKNIINAEKVVKYKLPLIEKPLEWGPDFKDFGGWHNKELQKALVKQNVNDGHELEINYKILYPVINKLQSIEYEINLEFLNFVLENKDKIYEVLLIDHQIGSVSYNTLKEQYDITLNIAVYMCKYDKFYFTYSFDYRGRLYVEQEYFNYQGNLLARSLIRWATAKKKNLYWLKIACVSLYKGLLGLEHETVLNIYKKEIDIIEINDWYEAFKKAKEPILWLSLFYELKTNKTDLIKYIIWFDATCSGSQILSLFLNDDTYLKQLNMSQHHEIMDYYTHIYNQYGKFKNVKDNHARKIVKKAIMTINYGLTLIGCHRYIYKFLKEFNYCVSKKDYKENWKEEVIKFYKFIENISIVQKLDSLQHIWNLFCKKQLIYQFVIGEDGFILDNDNNKFIQKKINEDFIFKMKTITYKKYYKNLSIYNKSRKMKEKGYKYLWHYNKIDKRTQMRKIRANLIHMLDGTWNILTCKNVNFDIATIHDCHGIHSYDVENYFFIVKDTLIRLFKTSNQYYYLLNNMMKVYYDCTNDSELYEHIKKQIKDKHYSYVFFDTWKWYRIRKSKFLFIPK